MNIDQNEIRMMSFNIRYKNLFDGVNSWKNRKDYVCGLVRFHGPDIIGFQEVLKDQLDYLENELTGYAWYGVGRDNGKAKGEFSPIFYVKEKFELEDQGFFWLSETPEKVGSIGWDAALTRVATWVKLRHRAQNKEFYIFNCHFDHKGQRAAEMSSLLVLDKMNEIAKGKPCLLSGDFNNTPESRMYQNFTRGGLQDTAGMAKPYGGDKTFHGFQALKAFYLYRMLHQRKILNELTTIDYIFVKNGITVIRNGILTDNIEGFYPSDHMPRVCDFIL